MVFSLLKGWIAELSWTRSLDLRVFFLYGEVFWKKLKKWLELFNFNFLNIYAIVNSNDFGVKVFF